MRIKCFPGLISDRRVQELRRLPDGRGFETVPEKHPSHPVIGIYPFECQDSPTGCGFSQKPDGRRNTLRSHSLPFLVVECRAQNDSAVLLNGFRESRITSRGRSQPDQKPRRRKPGGPDPGLADRANGREVAVPDIKSLVQLSGGVFVKINQGDVMGFDRGTPEKRHVVAQTNNRLRK